MTATSPASERRAPAAGTDPAGYGVLGRLGLAVTRHRRATLVTWVFVVIGLGVFAPRVESELSGAGWQADGSESVAVRDLAVQHFGGDASSAIQVVVSDPSGDVMSGRGADVLARATAILAADRRVGDVVPPQPGATISRDGHTAVLLAGAGVDTNEMVRVADDHMVAVFFTFALSGPLPPKEMGIVLGVAVLLDAFLVRLVLLPVLLRLTGRAAWWAPSWLRRALPDIHFSHG
jgi:uncharacterized membrane protein YdfJ with MMPL/SSD domain